MKLIILTIFFAILAINSNGQTIDTTYYKDQFFSKKTSAEKAKFLKIATKNADGTLELLFQQIGSMEIIEHYRNDEQIGIWTKGNKIKDFDFEINYSNTACVDTLEGISIAELFNDNSILNYKAPRIATGQKDLFNYLWEEVEFPPKSLNERLSGNSYISFEINEEGTIQNIQAKKGGKIFFDKEVVRMIRKLKLSSAPMLNNKPTKICVNLPFKFMIQ